jgi:dipeptide/tripeptide permease
VRGFFGLIFLGSVILVSSVPWERQFWLAFTAIALTLPTAMICVWWVQKAQRHPEPKTVVFAILASTLLKIVVAFGGGCALMLGTQWASANGLALGLWIAVAYLSLLTVEVFVLAKPGWIGRGGVSRKG